MQSTNFTTAIAELVRLLPRLREMVSRVHSLQLATVTDIDEQRRMVKVSTEAKAGQSQTDWIQAGRRSPFEDEPLPPIGTTVVVGAIGDDPHDLVLLRTITNATNPPDPVQRSPKDDHTEEIPGDRRQAVTGNDFQGIGGDRTVEISGLYGVSAAQEITIDSDRTIEISALNPPDGSVMLRGFQRVRLEDANGAYIQMANGLIELRDRYGRQWTLGASGWVFDLLGQNLQIINAGDVSINGKSIIVVGSTDSDSDVNNSRGY